MGRELTLGRILGLDLDPPRILVGTLFEFWMDKWISVERISFYFRRKPLKLCTPVLHPMFGNSRHNSAINYAGTTIKMRQYEKPISYLIRKGKAIKSIIIINH